MIKMREVLPLFVIFTLIAGFISSGCHTTQGEDVSKKSTTPSTAPSTNPLALDLTGCNPEIIDALLTVVENDIVPLTQQGVKKGNKVFGAAVMKKDDLSLVMAGTNHESECPLWHGEVYTIKKLWETAARPEPKECIFFATHQPCPMCLSAITWGGYDTIFYLFSYEDSRKTFNIPYDLQQMNDIFKLPGGHFTKKNAFWTSYVVEDLIKQCDEKTQAGFMARVQKLKKQYDEMSAVYQKTKVNTDIPFK